MFAYEQHLLFVSVLGTYFLFVFLWILGWGAGAGIHIRSHPVVPVIRDD